MIMGNHNGQKLDYRQEEAEKVLNKAKAECVFTDRLYEILLAHQNRDNVRPARRKPLRESERVGDLSLELSRLYNKIWSATLELNSNARSKKKEKNQIEAMTQ
jgi:hypothetical protein